MDRVRLLLASCGGLGLAPAAPGTFGTLGGVAIAWALSRTDDYLMWSVVTIVVLSLLSRPLGDWAERYAAGKDPQFFVLDEVIGYLVTVTWVAGPSPLALVLGFLLFRLFDITKPPPARRLERMGGGDGILLDDVVAGFYGLAVMAALRWLLPLEAGSWTI